MFDMCGTDMPGVSNKYIKGWSDTWVRDFMSVVFLLSSVGQQVGDFQLLLNITRIRSDVDFVHPGLAPTGAGLPPTFEQLHFQMKLW